jgi:hypothetical protein
MTASLTQAQSQAQVQRKIDTAKLIDFYHGHQIQDLKADLVQYSGNVEQLKPVCVNVVKKINNRLAQVYNKPATRAVTGTDQDQEVFNLIQNQARMNVKMKQASRFTKLVKTVLIRVLFRNGKLELDILTPDIVDVETGTSPEDLKAVIVTHYPASGNVRETQYHRWTANTFQVLNYKGDIISSETNEYGILPFVALHDACPVDEFFQPIPEDLASLQESINLKISDLLHTISFQSHGQPVSKGLPDKQTIKIGPNQAISLPADTRDKKSDFKFADTNAKIQEVVEAIQALINWAYISQGLPASSITSDAKEASGIAKQVDNFELDEMRRDDIELFRLYESQLFETIKVVNNHHNPRKLSEKCTLKIDFAEIKPPVSEKDQLEVWQILQDMGLLSVVDIAMKRNPDLSREDAEALIIQVQEDNKILEKTTI